MFGGSSHGEGPVAYSNDFLLFNECLAPHREKRLADEGRGLASSHENGLRCGTPVRFAEITLQGGFSIPLRAVAEIPYALS